MIRKGAGRPSLGPRKVGAFAFAAVASLVFFLTRPSAGLAVLFAIVVAGFLTVAYLLVDLKRYVRGQIHSTARGARSGKNLYAHKSVPPEILDAVKRAQQRLWLGFESRALAVLTSASTDRKATPSIRALAFLERAAWYAGNNDWRNSLENARLARVADPTPSDRQVSLEVDALIATGEFDAARELLDTQATIVPGTAAFELRRANTYLSPPDDALRFEVDGHRLAHINRLYRDAGIAPIAPRDPRERLVISNLDAPGVSEVAKGRELVSVLMPTYNSVETLEYSVNSVLAQSWRNLELIIIDDASTDETLAVAENLARLDARVKVLGRSVNGGPYVARNMGLAEARGSLITVHDSDDWAHPQKLEKQVAAWRASTKAHASISFHVRVDGDLRFLRPTRKHRVDLKARNLSSLLCERAVFDEVGFWDEVRTAGDSEFVGRLRAHYGGDAIVEVLPAVPLSLSLSLPSSLTGTSTTGFASMNHVLGARSQYRAAYSEWHQSADFAQELPLRAGVSDPFVRPKALIGALPDGAREHFDVVLLSNFSLPGGTTASNVQEIRAQKQAGLRTALIHHPVYDWGATRPPNPKILSEVDGESVRFLSLGESVSCDVLIIRLPKAIETLLDELPALDPGHVIVLANQTPDRYYRSDGVRERAYDLQKCTDGLRRRFGVDPVWYPIGPRVRRAFLDWHAHEFDLSLLSDADWVNVIDPTEWRRQGRRELGGPFRIGRHSRDSDVKWPTDPDVLKAAYPDSPEFQISVLGGASIPEKALGGLPSNWQVFPFDAISPREFLAALDVYVYFTPPGTIEAFGRGLLEALAVGVPLVTSAEFKELFGDAAIYAEPGRVKDVVRRLRDDPAYYERQVQKGFSLIDRKFSYNAHVRRVAELSSSDTPLGRT